MKGRNVFVWFFAGLLIVGCATTGVGMDDVNKGYEYLKSNEYAQAESYFQRALDADPNNPYALLDLGVVYQNTGRVKKARAMYRKVIHINAQDMPERVTKKGMRGQSLSDIARKNLSTLP
jgi:general secretion pathway protein D